VGHYGNPGITRVNTVLFTFQLKCLGNGKLIIRRSSVTKDKDGMFTVVLVELICCCT
jgi:hypothetical protein